MLGAAGGPFNGRHPLSPDRDLMKTHHLFNNEAAEDDPFEEIDRDRYLRAIDAGGFGVTVHDGDHGFLFEVAGPALTIDALRELYHWADDLADPAGA